MAPPVLRGTGGIFSAPPESRPTTPMRHMLNLESVITYEDTESILQLIVGRALTGKGAF